MEAIKSQVRALAATANKADIVHQLRELAASLESSEDTINRFGYLHLQTAVIVTGFDLGLFQSLVADDGPVTMDKLRLQKKIDMPLLGRLMTYLASIGAVDEVDVRTYAPNSVTRNLAKDVSMAGIKHCFETVGPMYQAMPAFLRETGYRSPRDATSTVFQAAWNEKRHVFSWFANQPEKRQTFDTYMALRRGESEGWCREWCDVVGEWATNQDPHRAVFVDVGGSGGHRCSMFKRNLPNTPGRVILQDLTTDNATAIAGVDIVTHDFFKEQPAECRGAKLYYLGAVLHNHPDENASRILSKIKEAMAADSIIVIHEMVLPETGVKQHAAAMDLVMAMAVAAQERTKSHWRRLIGGVGLALLDICWLNAESYEALIVVGRAGRGS